MSKDLREADNELLTVEVTDDEIFKVVKQTNLIKVPSPDVMQVIFCEKS